MDKSTKYVIDIETMGVDDSAVLISFCSYAFKGKKKIDCLHYNFNESSQEEMGRTTSEKTIKFWKKDNKDLYEKYSHGAVELTVDILKEIHVFMKKYKDGKNDPKIYAKFDLDRRVMNHVFNSMDIEIPWSFYQWKDVSVIEDELYRLCGSNEANQIKRDIDKEILENFGIHPVKHENKYDCLSEIFILFKYRDKVDELKKTKDLLTFIHKKIVLEEEFDIHKKKFKSENE